MNINFALILVILVFATGALILLDKFILAPRRARVRNQQENSAQDKSIEPPAIFGFARSLFPIFLIVLLLRSFLVEPFRIPSGSLEPTLLPGDFIFVNKFSYGLRVPVTNTKFVDIGEPRLGDIVVFRWPVNPSIDYIKRIIGTPGDHIAYINKQFFINGEPLEQEVVTVTRDYDESGRSWLVEEREETINGESHLIYVRPEIPAKDFEWTVPPGNYLAIGDNRDNSLDSRSWGFVPEEDLLGKAFLVVVSWDKQVKGIRWNRIGKVI